ncbi:MAG: NUMOD4 domain-containing protein [Flavobacteriales bacterium]
MAKTKRNLKFLPKEVWKNIPFEDSVLRNNYALSNYGRMVSFKERIEDGKILKGGILGGYKTLIIRLKNKSKTYFIHKLVAEYFIKKSNPENTAVIHLDYNKKNNHEANLRWASQKDISEHNQKNPDMLERRKKMKNRKPSKGHKLSSKEVSKLKKLIFDPNRRIRYKTIADQFNISEMQLYRIKSGENWSHIKVQSEEKEKSSKRRRVSRDKKF